MKTVLSFLIIICVWENSVYAQSKKSNPFEIVNVPDSIFTKLEEAYKSTAKHANAGRNVYNLLNRKDFIFKDGIYSFKGQGSHYPRRIFIFDKGKLFVFQNEGAFHPKGIIREFANAMDSLNLPSDHAVRYLKAVSTYLEEEAGLTYGGEIQK